jgi:hypothetical protein
MSGVHARRSEDRRNLPEHDADDERAATGASRWTNLLAQAPVLAAPPPCCAHSATAFQPGICYTPQRLIRKIGVSSLSIAKVSWSTPSLNATARQAF